MKPHLSKAETWLLRFAGMSHDAAKSCDVLRDWPPPEESRPHVAGMPKTFDEAWVCVNSLAKHQLITFYSHDKGATIDITGPGLQCLWELDHPDIVEHIQDLARRSPYTAYAILIFLAIGAASSFVGLIWKIATAIWTWLHP